MEFSPSVKTSLEKYCSNIIKWNKAYNLLSNSQDKDEIWNRHILDSTQLYGHLRSVNGTIIDLGSGAGFPSIPLAIMFNEDNGKNFILTESTSKKSNFLNDTVRILELKNSRIINDRIENIENLHADIITARAFAKISDIFSLTEKLVKPGTKFMLLKGRNIEAEIAEAGNVFSFDYQLINSATGDGFIFLAENVKHK